ncbi:PKD domain-containing protein [Halosimplex halophilum]|uniref:PKD domain-containing protein n=1 Tax=Halosimplex halophilum TaxID=2559572 RepID=UPI001435508B|nr:PKD domain-containing protein [Halosimplex halophilum]
MSAVLVVSAAFAAGPVAGGAVAAAGSGPDGGGNKAPLADAGLDRTVSANATVYLDATGSRDPDGEIDSYRWRLEKPDGSYTTPSCETCGRTRFVPRATGTYNATVTVTDEDGATSTDTLRVHVEPSNGPSVSISGPDSVVEGAVAQYTATVSAGANDLAAVVWRADGRRVNRTTLAGESASVDRLHAFRHDGTVTLRVTAVDRLGRQRTATKNVTVTAPSSPGSGGGSGSIGVGSGGGSTSGGDSGGDDDGSECSHYNRDDDRYCDNDRMTIDSNGIVISDADDDGSVQWAQVNVDEEFAQNNDGVSYDSVDDMVTFDSQEAYKEALGVDTVSVDPESEVNSDGRVISMSGESGNLSGGSPSNNKSSSDDDDSSTETTGSNNGDSGTSSNAGSGDLGNIPDRIRNTIQEKQSGTTTNSGNDTGTTNTKTGRVPPDRYRAGI